LLVRVLSDNAIGKKSFTTCGYIKRAEKGEKRGIASAQCYAEEVHVAVFLLQNQTSTTCSKKGGGVYERVEVLIQVELVVSRYR
jgi:hypothetical protein